MMAPDGTNLVNLTPDVDVDTYTSEVSPDGQRLIYYRYVSSSVLDLWVYHFASGSHTLVRELQRFENQATWYDNSTILYRRTEGQPSRGDIHRIDLDGNELGLILPASCFGQASIDDFRTSPDGSQIILTAQAGSWDPTTDIYIANIDGTGCRSVYADSSDNYRDFFPRWAPNGLDVYWMHTVNSGTSDNRAIYAAFDAGQPTQTVESIRPAEQRAVLHSLSPAGDSAVIQRTGEIVVVDLATLSEVLLVEAFIVGGVDWDFVDLGSSGDLTLSEPVPGLGGQLNTFSISNAPAGEQVYLAYGFIPGIQAVPGCPGVSLDIFRPTLAGSGVANIDGEVDITLFVPAGVTGRRTLLQAVERTNCTKSEVIDYLWP